MFNRLRGTGEIAQNELGALTEHWASDCVVCREEFRASQIGRTLEGDARSDEEYDRLLRSLSDESVRLARLILGAGFDQECLSRLG